MNSFAKMTWLLWFCLLGLPLFHCSDNAPPSGLFQAVVSGGPKVVFDLEATPLPEIPLPNDLATRVDPTSPTGLRLNVSMIAPTHLESSVRVKVNQLNGFGMYAPVTVRFDAPLDVADVMKRHIQNNDFADDAVYVVCLNPDSPMYGKPVLLDMGRGNFPVYLKNPSNTFDHDPHAGQHNLTFETLHEKDTNKNGKLDPNEDLDHDGVWDRPNTHPKDSQDKDAILTWYERETNTLIIRPVVPLQPGSKYAVILTRRLKGEDGKSIDSPFPWVNHTRQTPVLRRLIDDGLLASMGLKEQDIAFAWSFTTHTGAQELKDLRDGLYGHGPFRALSGRYPAKTTKLHRLLDRGDKPWLLPAEKLTSSLVPLLALMLKSSQSTQDALRKSFSYVDYVVSGELTTPFFLASRDASGNVVTGADALVPGVIPFTKTHFDLDRNSGRMVVGKEQVPWMCAIPKETAEHKAPFPVVFYAHGYTSGRFELLGFAGALARFGLATCGIDAVGHGVALPPAEQQILTTVLGGAGMGGTAAALSPGRAKDLNNDGVPDPGGDFWTADTFHTRDIVRQSVVDHMMLIRLMRSWDGKKTWAIDSTGDGKPNLKGIAGDFNGDGKVDLGGPAGHYHAWGQSLGGILSAILAGVEPAITSAAPVAAGGGLLHISARSSLSSVVAAVYLRMMGPFVMGYEVADKKMEFRFWVPDVNNKACSLTDDAAASDPLRHCLHLSSKQRVSGVRFAQTSQPVNEGDKIEIENLRSGEKRWALIRKQGKSLVMRFAIPADALGPLEKRGHLGIPTDSKVLTDSKYKMPEVQAGASAEQLKAIVYQDGKPKERSIPLLGDPLRMTIYEGTSNKVKETLSTFGRDVVFQGAVYRKGTPLFALAEGLGLRRQSPDFRRFQGFAGMILEPGDPIVYAPLYHLRPLYYHYEQRLKAGSNVLVVPTLGDSSVPVDTGIAIARAAGILPALAPDTRYPDPKQPGSFLTANALLIRSYVVEGVSRAGRFVDPASKPGAPQYVLFDPDNLSNGMDGFGAPRLRPPLRLVVPTVNGVAGLRIPYIKKTGDHGFHLPTPDAPFDVHSFMINQIGMYFRANGTKIDDRPCLATYSCPEFKE